jgi:modulator of FtsH protease HflC
VALPSEISEQVFNRMKSERAREAAEYRAKGSEQSQTIKAEADRQAIVIKADAQRQADQLRGDGDSERNRVFAEAYGKDPDFFAFYRSMEAYRAGLKGETRLVLSPDSAFLRFLNDPGKTADAAPSTGPAPAPTVPAPQP